MKKTVGYDYSDDLDILHVYTSEISGGIKGCITSGNFNIDIGQDNKVVGVEVESASQILNLSPDILNSLDATSLLVRKIGNQLFIGVAVAKKQVKSSIQFRVTNDNTPIAIVN